MLVASAPQPHTSENDQPASITSSGHPHFEPVQFTPAPSTDASHEGSSASQSQVNHYTTCHQPFKVMKKKTHTRAVDAMTALSAVHLREGQHLLNELNFMDIYVCLKGDGKAHYRLGVEDGIMSEIDEDVPQEYADDVQGLVEVLRNDFPGVERGLSYGGMRLRASKLENANGEIWAAMRRIEALPPLLDDIGFVPQLLPILREVGRRSGLIFLCGATGQGKTTTASSLLLDYLSSYGGVAFTIEDPVEYDLEGRQGKSGYCYQAEIKNEGEWGLMLKRSLRWHPRYIVVGEVRTPDAADQLLRAATSGHTVLTTMHAGSMEEGLEGLLQLAEKELGARAPLLLAAGLTAVVHQTFGPMGLNANFMVTEADNPGSPIRALIREKRIGMSRTFADQQMALLMKEGRIFHTR